MEKPGTLYKGNLFRRVRGYKLKQWGLMLAKVGVIIGIYFAWFFTALYIFNHFIYQDNAWFQQNTLIFIVFNDIVSFPLMYLALKYIFKVNIFQAARYRKMGGRALVLSLVVGLGAGLFTVAFAQWPGIQSELVQFNVLFDYLYRVEWYVFLLFLLLGNIYKETLFRGVLLNAFRGVLPLIISIILQGILYGVLFFTGDIPLSIYGFLGAVIFALIYVWFDSIWAPIAAQVACQGIQYILWHWGPKTDNLPVLITGMVISLIIIVIGMFLSKREVRNTSTNQGAINL